MANAWDTNAGNVAVPRDQAITKIKDMAIAEGITGAYKVFYAGTIIASPTDLPELVDMRNVRVSSVLDNATI